MEISDQVGNLFLLALPVACIAWTVTHEEIFQEPRDFCVKKSEVSRSVIVRKFFYLFTCEYCFSHYVALLFIFISKYHLLFPDWRGYLFGGFALVWITNVYMSLFGFIRVGMKQQRLTTEIGENKLNEGKKTESENSET